MAGAIFAIVTVPIWCGSFAEERARREGWNEPIEFAGRPASLEQLFRPTIWIATDRRLLEGEATTVVAVG